MKNTALAKLKDDLQALWDRTRMPEGVDIIETSSGESIRFLYTLDTPRARYLANLERLRGLPKGVTRIHKGDQQ